MSPHASAVASGPTAPGGCIDSFAGSICPEARRSRPCASTPFAIARNTARPCGPPPSCSRFSASASNAGSSGERAWLEIQHVHRHAVDARGVDNAGGESLTDHRRRAVGRFGSRLRRHQARSALCGRTGHRDGKTIQQQQPASIQQCRIIRRPCRQQVRETARQRDRWRSHFTAPAWCPDRPYRAAASTPDVPPCVKAPG